MLAVAGTQNNLKAILEERNMSGYKLAQNWGKATNYVYELLNKSLDHVDGITLLELADELDCSIDRIVGRSGYCNGK